jgi:YtcA family
MHGHTRCTLADSAVDEQERKFTSLRIGRLVIAACSCLFIVACNPVISVAGAQFPVWMLCLLAGILAALALRPILVATGIDEWMTPRLLTYVCLALVSGFLCWLVVWR